MSRLQLVYLVDYACFKPLAVSCAGSTFMGHTRLINSDEKSVQLQMQILEASRAKAQLMIFSAVDVILQKTGLKSKDINILVINSSLFSPATIINKYNHCSNVRSFNLSGKGCSTGLISINLVCDLLQAHASSNALVISTRILTPNFYVGHQLLPNCLFRMGTEAILLSNCQREAWQTKYRLVHVVRTHKGADNRAYRCTYEEENTEGHSGSHCQKIQ